MNKESISSIDMEVREYCRVHDAYFDPIRDEWIEDTCGNTCTCEYCYNRPEKPSEVTRYP